MAITKANLMTITTFVVTLPSSETIGSIKAIFSRMTSRKPYKMLIKIKFIKKYPSLQSASRMWILHLSLWKLETGIIFVVIIMNYFIQNNHFHLPASKRGRWHFWQWRTWELDRTVSEDLLWQNRRGREHTGPLRCWEKVCHFI